MGFLFPLYDPSLPAGVLNRSAGVYQQVLFPYPHLLTSGVYI